MIHELVLSPYKRLKVINDADNATIEEFLALIDQNLPDCLEFEIIDLLITEGLRANFFFNIRYIFVDMVMKRFKFITKTESKNLVLFEISENQDKITDFVLKRKIFPNWLSDYCAYNSNYSEVLKLIKILFDQSLKNGEFQYFQEFLTDRSEIQIFYDVLLQEIESEHVSGFVRLFYVFQKKDLYFSLNLFEACFDLFFSSKMLKKQLFDSV